MTEDVISPVLKNIVTKKKKAELSESLHFETPYSKNVDRAALQKELEKNIRGEVRFDDGSKSVYSTDASNYRQIPIGVVIPKSE